jgi:formate C-acetyltransferase
MPTYVDPASSLLGGYFDTFLQYPTRWDPNDYWNDLVAGQKKYRIIHGMDNAHHFAPDISIGVECGFGGLLEKIEVYRKVNRSEDSQAFYDGLNEVILGVEAWILRHAEAARKAAESEQDPELRKNLEELAEQNEFLGAGGAPRTYRETLQWLGWYQMAKRCYSGGGALGRIDQVLFPFYARELAAGTLDDETAIFHLISFFVLDTPYVQVGGVNEEGADITNPVSFHVLEAAHRIGIPANIAVVVHDAMDPSLFRRALELICRDRLGIPRFCGLDAMVRGLEANGVPAALARTRTQVGCHWFSLPGREYVFCDVIKINIARVLEVALDELREYDPQEWNLDTLWRLFEEHLRRAVDITARGIDRFLEGHHKYYPELPLSLLCHGPIEKGVDASHGGVEYTHIGVDASGLATVADSFGAIRQRIECERSVSWAELFYCLNQNWPESEKKTRLLMQSVPGYGRGGTAGDEYASRITKLFSGLIRNHPTPDGHTMIPGQFSWASTISMGRETGATPDGRGAGEPLSFGVNPNGGGARAPLVVTAVSNAIASVQCGWGNPSPYQMDIDPGFVMDEELIAKFGAVVRGHFARGGLLINVNVLDRKTILEAYRDPESHPDLVVRVTGFSVYFAALSPEFRKLVYDRVVELETQEV